MQKTSTWLMLTVLASGAFIAGRAWGTCVDTCTGATCFQFNNIGGTPPHTIDYTVVSGSTPCYKVMHHTASSGHNCNGTTSVTLNRAQSLSPNCTTWGASKYRTATACGMPDGNNVPMNCCMTCGAAE